MAKPFTSVYEPAPAVAPAVALAEQLVVQAVAAPTVANTVDMTPSLGDIIKEVSFSAQNNQLVEQSITGFAFPNNTVRSFAAIVIEDQ